MAGTKAGGKKARDTNRERYGDDFYAKIGKKGGSASSTGGFAADKELARLAGSIGGRKSRINEGKKKLNPKEIKEAEKALKEYLKDRKQEGVLERLLNSLPKRGL